MHKKGDILKTKKPVRIWNMDKEMYHAAVVWQDEYDGRGDFLGIMLTTDCRKSDNILMLENHFNETLKFKFKESRFVNQLFYKLREWSRFIKVGELTEQGIVFIEENLTNTEPMLFSDYITRR